MHDEAGGVHEGGDDEEEHEARARLGEELTQGRAAVAAAEERDERVQAGSGNRGNARPLGAHGHADTSASHRDAQQPGA